MGAKYCDFSNPPEHIIDPGLVDARGVHLSSIRADQDLEQAAQLLGYSCDRCRWACGEVGLDYHTGYGAEHQAQRRFLGYLVGQRRQIPLISHLRGTSGDPLGARPLQDLLTILHEAGLPRWTVFRVVWRRVQLATQANHVIYFSLGRSILSASPQQIAGIRAIPSDRLLVETDSPYFPVGVSGDMSPLHIGTTYERLAEIRAVTLEEICALVLRNFRDMFGGYVQEADRR